MIDTIRRYAIQAGREPQAIGIEGRIAYGQGVPDTWHRELEAWQSLGATHVSFNAMKSGLTSPSAHIEALRHFSRVANRR